MSRRSSGTVLYTGTAGKPWAVRWYEAGGARVHRRRRGFKTEAAAEAFLDAIEHRLAPSCPSCGYVLAPPP